MAKPPKRTVGEIFLALEEMLDELIDDHGFQWGDILWWVFGHLKIHRPDAREKYLEGGHPKFDYKYDRKKKKK